MRAAQLNDQNIVINFAEVNAFDYPFIDPTGLQIGDHLIDGVVQPKTPDELEAIKQRTISTLQGMINSLESMTYLNRGSREMELVVAQDLATRKAAILQPSMPDKTIEEIAALVLASNVYYVKLVALNSQISAIRSVMAAL